MTEFLLSGRGDEFEGILEFKERSEVGTPVSILLRLAVRGKYGRRNF